MPHNFVSTVFRSAKIVLLLGALATAGHTQVVTIYFGSKQHNFVQRTSDGPVEAGLAKYRFGNSVYVSDGNSIATPTVTLPSGFFAGASDYFQLGTSNDWIRNYDFTSKDAIDTFFGSGGIEPGDYTYGINGQTATLTLGAEAYPSVATITGGTWVDSELVANNTSDYVLTFSGPTAETFDDGIDYLRLTVRPQGSGTTYVFDSFTFTSSFVIPAFSLVDGTTYDVELQVFNTTELDNTSITGTTGLIGYSTETFLELLVDNSASAVPEPSTSALLCGGLVLGLGVLRRPARQS